MAWFEHGTSRIYYEESGSGEPVLLLPGFSDRIEAHVPLREALAAAGYRVIAADLPGSGRSLPQPRTYTVSYYEDDARSFAALLAHLATGPTHLMGFSDGGETVLLLAEMLPDVVRSVVTWGAAGKHIDPTGELRGFMRNMIDHPIPPMQGYRDYLVATYGEANARFMTQSFTEALTAIIDERGGDVSFSKADTILCPTLLMVGEHDMLIPAALLSELGARIPHAETLVLKNAEHEAHNTRPEWFSQTILDWLKQISSVRA
jgi:pimeloyl-ACP methyl ester carboxylesterase